jgi:hypothetical protein
MPCLSTFTNFFTIQSMTKQKVLTVLGSSAVVGMLLISGTAFAQTTPPAHAWGGSATRPGVFGTVSVISGDSLTVTSKGFGSSNAAATTYTVDATNAAVTKAGAASTLASVSVGDVVAVQGTVSGTSVTATTIRDGISARTGKPGMMGNTKMGERGMGSTTPILQGNGQPVVGGTVTAVSGSTITITNASNVTYTIDATNAKIVKGGSASTVSSVAVGDNLVIQGTVNGSSVTAATITDQAAASAGTAGSQSQGHGGFMNAVGGFFHKLFGFF